jgi:ribonuclease-3
LERSELASMGHGAEDFFRDNPQSEGVEDVLVEEIAPAAPVSGLGRSFIDDAERIRACEAALGYTFFNKALLLTALTHSSSAQGKRLDNERLEFFGDAILDLVVREHLFHNYPNRQEGDLTEAKSVLVCRASLVRAAKRIALNSFLALGRGMGRRRSIPESLLADAYEAILAAIYLDGGLQPVRNFILTSLGEDIPSAMGMVNSNNYKSTLQKALQQNRLPLPVYSVLGTAGPEHSRVFQVAVMVGGQELGRGAGLSKKAAEQEAAHAALENPRFRPLSGLGAGGA